MYAPILGLILGPSVYFSQVSRSSYDQRIDDVLNSSSSSFRANIESDLRYGKLVMAANDIMNAWEFLRMRTTEVCGDDDFYQKYLECIIPKYTFQESLLWNHESNSASSTIGLIVKDSSARDLVFAFDELRNLLPITFTGICWDFADERAQDLSFRMLEKLRTLLSVPFYPSSEVVLDIYVYQAYMSNSGRFPSIQRQIRDFIANSMGNDIKTITFTGHSTGAAVAALAALDIAQWLQRSRPDITVRLVTFACPQFANKRFWSYLEALNVSDRHYFNAGDLFPWASASIAHTHGNPLHRWRLMPELKHIQSKVRFQYDNVNDDVHTLTHSSLYLLLLVGGQKVRFPFPTST